jgi:CoA-binding domain
VGAPLTTQWLGLLRLSHKSLGAIAALSDAYAVVCASVVTGVAYHMITSGHAGGVSRYIWVGSVLAAAIVSLMKLNGLHALDKLLSVRAAARSITLTCIGVLIFWFGVSFTLKFTEELSRRWILSLTVAGPVFILYLRHGLSCLMSTALRLGALKRRKIILITTNTEPVSSSIEVLGTYDVVETYVWSGKTNAMQSAIAKAIRAAHRTEVITEIDLAMDWSRQFEIRRVLSELKAVPLPVRLLADSAVREILRYPGDAVRSHKFRSATSPSDTR